MGVRHRASRLLVPVLVGMGSAHCSLTLDLDRYSFETPSRAGSAGAAGSALAGQGGEVGEGGRGAGEGGMGEAAAGGSAGSSAGRGGSGGGGGESGATAGASGEGGEGGSPEMIVCNDGTGPMEPRCELVPVAVYVTLSGGCTGPVALGVDALGHVSSTLTTDMPECGGVHGDIVVTPDRRRVVALNGGGTGQITFTYEIDPVTHALTQSRTEQFRSDAALSSWDDAAIRKGPSGSDFDFLFITNEANDGDQGGLYALSIDHGQFAGAIEEIGIRRGVNEARGVAVHPTRDFVYVIRDPYNLNTGIVGLTFGIAGITDTVPSVPAVTVASGEIPTQLLADPAGRFLYFLSSLKIRSFGIDLGTGSLTSHSATSDAPTANFQRIAAHPNGQVLYAAGDDEILAFESRNGSLSPLDLDNETLNGITGKAVPDVRDLEVDASGRFLFLTTTTTTLSFAILEGGLLGVDPLMPSVDQPGSRLAVLDEWRLKP